MALTWSCFVRYSVPVPRMYQGLPALFASSTAPVTGVPALPAVPLLKRRVANVSGWLWLSVWLKSSSHDKSPLLLPTDALASQARKVESVW